MTLLTPLWPLAEPPSRTDRVSTLCERESEMTIRELGYLTVLRKAAATDGPEMFIRDSETNIRIKSVEGSRRRTGLEECQRNQGIANSDVAVARISASIRSHVDAQSRCQRINYQLAYTAG